MTFKSKNLSLILEKFNNTYSADIGAGCHWRLSKKLSGHFCNFGRAKLSSIHSNMEGAIVKKIYSDLERIGNEQNDNK